jgi:peptide/nickel transport system substrate-binding protein
VKIKHIASAIAVVAVGALVLSGCSQPYSSEVVKGSEITVAYNSGFFSYNSLTAAGKLLRRRSHLGAQHRVRFVRED